jgi:FkbM family methyltransferase
MLRKAVELLGRRFGITIVPDWRVVELDGERHLRRLLDYLKVDCVFDVGANEGQYATFLRKEVGYAGRIISFEPNPAALHVLKARSAEDPLWNVEGFALGAKEGRAQFNAYSESSLASFRSVRLTRHVPPSMSTATIEVSVKALKDYLPEARRKWKFHRPFLKMDTQGFDLEVAKGAEERLGEFLGIQSEIAFQTIYDDAPNYVSALGFYDAAGFRISRIIPIHEIYFPELVEMDVIMIRNDLIRITKGKPAAMAGRSNDRHAESGTTSSM